MILVSFSYGVIVTLVPDISKMIGWHNKGLYFTIFTLSSILVRVFLLNPLTNMVEFLYC